MTYIPPVFPLHLLATLPLSGKQQYLHNLLRDEPLVSINSENAHFVKHLAENEGALLLSLLGFSLDDDGYFRVHGDLAALHPLWLCAHAELCQYPGVKIRSLPGQPNEIIRSLNAVISTQIGVNFQDSVMTVLEDTRPSVNAARMVFPSRQNPFSLYDRQMAALMLGCIPIFNPIEYEFAYTKRVAENPAAQPFYLDAIEIFTKTASTQEPHERLTALLKRERQQHRHSQTEIEDACYLLNLPFHQLSDVADDMLITVHDLAVSDAPSNAKRYAEALSVLADVRQSQALQAHAAILLTTATTAASSRSVASPSHPPSTALVLRSKDAPSPPPLPPLASLTATSSSSPATAAAADAQAMAVDTSAAADATADVVAPTLPIGLTNEGNFCYLNSLLQYFFSLRKLRDLMFREKRLVETSFPRPKPVNPFHDDVEMLVDAQAATERPRSAAAPDYQPAMDRVQQELAKRRAASATNSGQQFLIHMARLFARMVYSDRQAVTPTSELVQLVVKMRPDQASDGQQDVGEYQSIMMDLFEQGFRSLQPDPAAEHPLKSLFMGVTQYIVASKPDPAQPDAPAATSAEAPPGSRVVKEDFISLMVNPAPTLHEALVRSLSGMAAYRDEPVAPSSMSSMPADLVSDLMSSPAARDGRPAVDLPASELPDPDTPQTYIAALPDVLMFQINRVSDDRATGNAYKNQVFLQFPDELHMGRYLATHDRDAIQKRRREELRL
ncbi:LOW QUALITY PROTEIN: cysteine proteinase, partial [Caulochytrium protostelioides]